MMYIRTLNVAIRKLVSFYVQFTCFYNDSHISVANMFIFIYSQISVAFNLADTIIFSPLLLSAHP
jgi:hypothetical protein